MRRVFALLSVLAIAEGCRIPCHWHNPKPLINYFNQLADKLAELDRIQADHCSSNNAPESKYMYGESEFKMIIPADGFCGDDFSIKTGRRLLLIEACNCDEDLKFSDLRFIPDFLDLRRAKWTFDNEELIITIPYVSGSLNSPHKLSYFNRNQQSGAAVMRRRRT